MQDLKMQELLEMQRTFKVGVSEQQLLHDVYKRPLVTQYTCIVWSTETRPGALVIICLFQ